MKPLYTHKTHSHQPLNINDYERRMATLNDRIASVITSGVSTMWCAYAFALLALIGFPGLHATPTLWVQWVSQTFIQLVMLSILAVSQGQIGEHQQLVADEQFSTTTKTYQELEESHKHLDAQDTALIALHAELVQVRRLLEQQKAREA